MRCSTWDVNDRGIESNAAKPWATVDTGKPARNLCTISLSLSKELLEPVIVGGLGAIGTMSGRSSSKN